MKQLNYPYSELVTLVTENYGEKVNYSHATQANTYEEMLRHLKMRKKRNDLDPLVYEFEEPTLMSNVSFSIGYTYDVMLIDNFSNVLGGWTEPASFSENSCIGTFEGVLLLVYCPEGFIRKAGILPGISKLTLVTGMPYEYTICHVRWSDKLKNKSDQGIIDMYNAIVDRGYDKYFEGIRMETLGHEIFSRSFDSSILFVLNPDGTIYSMSGDRRVKLMDNTLAYE